MEEWSKYFKDKSLVLNDVHIKVRTNNSLENFNRTFKYSYNMKGHMKLIKYIDTLLEFAKDQIEFFKERLNEHILQKLKRKLNMKSSMKIYQIQKRKQAIISLTT